MDSDMGIGNKRDAESTSVEVKYNQEKDFYRGMAGELRFKAEGLFKKAKEKGISIEEISLTTLKENRIDFPGIGVVELPAYMVTVKGRDIQTQQVIVDGKHIDYYNRYQRYVAEKLEKMERKGSVRGEERKSMQENNTVEEGQEKGFALNDREKFEIAKSILEDKEFGIEKTITGACERVIRKLMGENDWLYPEEARLLDEEFGFVQGMIAREKENKKSARQGVFQKKATERQINYLKALLKNAGLDAENDKVIKEVLRQSGFGEIDINELSSVSMSRIIDSASEVIPKVKDLFLGLNCNDGDGNMH